MDFGIARHRIDIPFVEMHHWARLAQRLLGGVRILEELDRKRINIEARDPRKHTAARRAWASAANSGRTCCDHGKPPKLYSCKGAACVSISRGLIPAGPVACFSVGRRERGHGYCFGIARPLFSTFCHFAW